MKFRYLQSTTGILISAIILATGATTLQAENRFPPSSGIPDSPISSEEEISEKATKALQHIVEARKKIHTREMTATIHELNQAMTLIERIKAARPNSRISNQIWVAEKHINMAHSQLEEGKVAAADKDLSIAEAGMQFVSIGEHVPLLKARIFLRHAMEDYSVGHHEAVKTQLTQAQEWLERAKAEGDPKTQYVTQQLQRKIEEMLEQESHRNPEAESALAGFWHRTVGLLEREVEKLYHAWRDQETENHLYRQLIDAKMHLFYAEHELFVSNDVDDANQELKQTISYLQAAAATATGERKARIEALEKEVEALASFTSNPDTNAKNQYDKALADMRLMVKGM